MSRIHREWFRPVSLGNRKSCPKCHEKLAPSELIWSWGEYHVCKWRTVAHFCVACWPELRERLLAHRNSCGCEFTLVPYHCILPSWLSLEVTCSP
jgi:hypothetical protein